MRTARRGADTRAARPEVLAPAGGPASWAAAVQAGADAVYAGLDRFSARTYAENFSLSELSGMVSESHRLGVRVYLAFNSLIKDSELADAFKVMCAAAEMGPDAFIIQDLGLVGMARRHFPQIPLHASTLTAVHTLDGLEALAGLGFSRAVLPRELAAAEIAALAPRSPLDLEVFVHGSLCFCFSGLCLMSSFLGGRSALRGGCTQPCRRVYQNAGRQKTFFSLSDLNGLAYVPQLAKMSVRALKIEGRMKGPDYVGQVVRAYRKALETDEADYPAFLEETMELFSRVPGRAGSAGFLAGNPFLPELWDSQNASGLQVGRLAPAGPGLGTVTLKAPLKLKDRLRLAAGPGDEGTPHKLRLMWLDGEPVTSAEAGATVTLALGDARDVPPAGQLYKSGSGSLEKELLASEPVKRLKSLARQYQPPQTKIPPRLAGPKNSPPAGSGKTQPLWLWLDGPANLLEMIRFRPRKIILPLTPENVKDLARQKKTLGSFTDFVWSLPPLFLGRSQEKARREAARLAEAGHRDFMIANIGQIAFLNRLKPDLRIWADHHLGILNHLAGHALHDMGLSGVTLSLESDQEVVQKLSAASFSGGVLLYLYGRPALFTARFRPPSLRRGPVVSQRGEKFWTAEDGDAFILQSEHRVYVSPLLKAPKPRGFVGMIVDLRREPNPAEAARRVRKAIDQGRGSPGLAFNFKRGLQ
ncbi:MAG: U32 family peptidase [Deltaproteobacteria bacterium]|nr:U32 family peptidase [Deltaproteobacteria bacterium]